MTLMMRHLRLSLAFIPLVMQIPVRSLRFLRAAGPRQLIWLAGAWLTLGVMPASAQQTEWPVFPSAQVSERNQQFQRDFEFPLGAIRRELDGHVGPNPSERIAGQKTSTTYQVTGAYSSAEIFAFLRKEVAARGYHEKFLCESFQCGRSSFWANNYFGVANLFGPDRNQHMLSAVSAQAKQHEFVVIYVVERANRRLYYHITEITAEAGQSAGITTQLPTLLAALEHSARVVLPGLVFTEAGQLDTPADAESLAVIRELLQVLANRPIALVGHDRSSQGNLDQQIQRSLTMAQNVAAQLGNQAKAVPVRGVGPLAPSVLAPETRWVELVLME
jgi:hypothetical protein